MAASARAVSPADLRIACPLCGGIIHPLAGRCKHCKGDLTQAHQARLSRAAAPQIAALPPLGGGSVAAPVDPHAHVAASPWAPGGMGGAALATPRGLAPFTQAKVPVYGRVGETPLLDGSGTSAPDEAPRAKWVWWVIGAAVLAIIAALVLLVWPTDKPSATKRVGAGGDSMSTSPLPDRSPTGPNPWSAPGPTPPSDPGAGGSAAPVDPDDDDDLLGGGSAAGSDSIDDALDDIFGALGSLGGGSLGGGGGTPGSGSAGFLGKLADKTCDRLEACGLPGFVCNQVRSLVTAMGGAMFGRCTVDDGKAEACLDAVGALSCDDVDMTNLQSTAGKLAGRCRAALDCPPGVGGFDLDAILKGGSLGGGSTGP